MAAKTKSARSIGWLARVWIRFALVACIALVFVAYYREELIVAATKVAPGLTFVYLAASLTLSTLLFVSALEIARRDETLDLTVAAEVLVAFGIFSMFVGLMFALFAVFQSGSVRDFNDDRAIWAVVRPFIESIAAAGVGPIFATALRFQDSGMAAASSGENAAAERVEIAASVRKVQVELEAVAAGLRNVSGELEKQKIAIAGGMGGLVQTISEQEAAISSATDATKSAVERFAAALTGGASSFEGSASASSEHLRQLAEALRETKEAASGLHRDLASVGESSQRAKTLLDALSDFIASLENFDLSRKQ